MAWVLNVKGIWKGSFLLLLPTFVVLLPGVGGAQGVAQEPGHAGKRAEANVTAVQQVIAAAAHFRHAIRDAPQDPTNYVQLMHALFLDDQRAQLAAWMLRYETLFPERTKTNTFQFNLAMTLYGLYRREEALERFVRSLCSPPPAEPENMLLAGPQWQERAFQHIGLLLEKANEPLHAARAYITTVRLHSREHPKYGVYLVTALLSAGRVREAAALHSALLGIPGASFPRLSRPISDFRVTESSGRPGRASGTLFSPWLGVLHHALHVFPEDALKASKHGELTLWHALSPARVAMRQRIHYVQYPKRDPQACRDRPVLIYSLADSSAGLGAEAHGLVLALNLAVALNRTLVLPRADTWWYTERSRCSQGGWDCYFQPVSTCYVEDTEPSLRKAFTLFEGLAARAYIPGEARVDEDSEGILAWRAELAAFLMRPHGGWAAVGVDAPPTDIDGPFWGGGARGGGGGAQATRGVLKARVGALKRAVGWPERAHTGEVLALHIRRGDRMITRRLVGVAEYLDAAAAVAAKRRVSAVLLCTEVRPEGRLPARYQCGRDLLVDGCRCA